MVSIIVVFRKKDYIRACLDSIKEQAYAQIETIVIDNSADKDFSQSIIARYAEVRLFLQENNISYCEALNLGIKQSRGDFILCLNDDVTLDKRFIEESLRGFSVGAKVGMVSGKILRNDKETIDSAGLFLTPWRAAKERGYGAKDKGRFEKEEYIFGVNGAVAFYRKEMLEEIKEGQDYFDSGFHYFYEDLDIAWRAQRFGWGCFYNPKAIAYHLRGGTARPAYGIGKTFARSYLNDELHLCLLKNRYSAIIKNESLCRFLFYLPALALYDFIIWCYILLFKPQLVKKFLMSLKNFRILLKKRKLIKNKLRLPGNS